MSDVKSIDIGDTITITLPECDDELEFKFETIVPDGEWLVMPPNKTIRGNENWLFTASKRRFRKWYKFWKTWGWDYKPIPQTDLTYPPTQ